MTAPATPVSFEHLPAGTATLALWDPSGAAREGFALWCAACSAWGDYLSGLACASGPAAMVDAQTRLLADCLDLCSQATANRLKDAGVATPLLNDA